MNFVSEFLNLFYPNLCLICGNSLLRNEHQICLSCLHEIPKTGYHLQKDNPLEKRFWGKVPIYRGAAYYFFHKGSPFQKLLHELKYKGNKEIGVIMGRYAAAELLHSPDFCSIDVILPVPLHPKKYAKRGYNQSDLICKGIAEVLEKPVDYTNLRRIRENTTQTKKSVYDRYLNTENLFKLKDKSAFQNKHVLIVDDVLTTGSTLESCIKALLDTPGIKISVFTLAIA
jgi:ComF family protein